MELYHGPHILGVETLLLSLSSGVFSDHLLFVPYSWTVCVCLNVLEAWSQSGHLYFTDIQNITQITSVLPDGFSQTKHTNKSFDQMKKQHYPLLLLLLSPSFSSSSSSFTLTLSPPRTFSLSCLSLFSFLIRGSNLCKKFAPNHSND